MKKYSLISNLFLLLTLVATVKLAAQEKPAGEKPELQELRLKLNEDGTHFLKFTILGQLWLRLNESNPQTTVANELRSQTFDIGIRRLRFQFFGQITDHASFYFHFGQDNFNHLSPRKFTPFIEDILGEYKVKKRSEQLIIGGGLTMLGGLSRFTQPQLVNIMSMDVPVFTLPTFDLTDQAGRKLSVYARGQVGRLDYRLAMSQPFTISTSGTVLPALSPTGNPTSPNANFAQKGNHNQFQSLIIWNFLDREPHSIAFMPGAYYGKKKVVNLEAGFITQKKATWSSPDGGMSVDYHPLTMWSVASFLDLPLNTNKGDALNVYAGYFHMNYGHGYLRYVGVMNPADGPAPSTSYFAAGYGNAFPMYGTGHVIYSQLGYLFKKDFLGKSNGTLMPYITLQAASYDRLDKGLTIVTTGINWFITGNTSKLTLDYQNRPVYSVAGNKLVRESFRRGQYVLQYQFFF